MRLPKILVRALARFAADNLRGEVVALLAENEDLRKRQVTLFGSLQAWWQRKVASYADVSLRREVVQLRAHVDSLQRLCDHRSQQIVDLQVDLRRADLDTIRSSRGQYTPRTAALIEKQQ